jgi:iron(III) transport system ATP-binding protein
VSNLRIEHLTKSFGGKPPAKAIDDLSLEIESGEFLVLLGPSGCGKTTTLRCVAGLETAGEGRIEVGDATLFDSTRKINLAPEKRNLGMVFQSYALWPHMTVRRNIRYPLRARRMKDAERTGRVEEAAELVECSHLLDRYPGQLSGGQQQRIALARGLVARPDLVLFDEPLSNLDARLRDQVRGQLHELHGRLGFTAVFVTHDQSEALALADRIAVLRDGHLEQIGTPDTVYERPDTEYVADFLGMSNRLPVAYDDGTWALAGRVVNGEALPASPLASVVRFRNEDLHAMPLGAEVPRRSSSIVADVVDAQFAGRCSELTVKVNGSKVHAIARHDVADGWARTLRPGSAVQLCFQPSNGAYFGEAGARVEQDRHPAPVALVPDAPAFATAEVR